MKLPAHGWLHTPMSVVYFLHNNSESLLTLDVSMEANEAFMMAGHKDVCVFKKIYYIIMIHNCYNFS